MYISPAANRIGSSVTMNAASILVFTLAVIITGATKLPASFKLCNRKAADVDKCYLDAANHNIKLFVAAFPEVNLPSLKPLEITQLKIGAGSQGVVNVEQNFNDCKLYGIDTAEFSDFNVDFEKKKFSVVAFVPELKKLCQYELNGKVLLLPIVGKGGSTVILNKLKITYELTYEEVARKGKTFMKFTSNKLTLDPETVSFDFENLFNGDKQLGDNINKVLNDNQKEVFEDVKKGYEEGLGLVLQQIVGNMFSKVSIQEAFE